MLARSWNQDLHLPMLFTWNFKKKISPKHYAHNCEGDLSCFRPANCICLKISTVSLTMFPLHCIGLGFSMLLQLSTQQWGLAFICWLNFFKTSMHIYMPRRGNLPRLLHATLHTPHRECHFCIYMKVSTPPTLHVAGTMASCLGDFSRRESWPQACQCHLVGIQIPPQHTYHAEDNTTTLPVVSHPPRREEKSWALHLPIAFAWMFSIASLYCLE